MSTTGGRLGILVGGGPAPGINSAISAAAIEAIKSGLEVVGIYDGFQHLMKGRTDVTTELTIEDVSRIHSQGGSVLRTARANPTTHKEDLDRVVQTLKEMGISYLVTIGGDDTSFAASSVSQAADGSIKVAHVPKTIDNDLPLPDDMPTFGFETARDMGTDIALNLREDARTTNRWFFVVVMGRKAGHLAIGIAKAAGATLSIIPEEFPGEKMTVDDVAAVIEGAILKRRAMGHKDGLAVISEGIGERIDPNDLAQYPGVEVNQDPYGHIRLGEIPLANILRSQVRKRFADRGENLALVATTLGYELRCASPIPFDVDYTRSLGYGAVRTLLDETNGKQGGLVCLEDSRLKVLPFDALNDPETGRTRVRTVDVNAQAFRIAREYMIRLEKADLKNPDMLAKLAEVAHLTPQEFKERFSPVVALTL